MVDAVLAETRRVQSRVRDLPSRVVVYLLLAAGLFADIGLSQVWTRLCAGLAGAGFAIRHQRVGDDERAFHLLIASRQPD